MKNPYLLLVLGALALTGCQSLSDAGALRSLTKVALISVVANDQVYYVGEKPVKPQVVTTLTRKVSNAAQTTEAVNLRLEKTDVLTAKAEELLTAALASAKGKDFTAKADLFASKGYAGVVDNGLDGFGFTKPEGFKFLRFDDREQIMNLARELGANGLIAADFLFQKERATAKEQSGVLVARTTLTISAYNRDGRLSYRQAFVGTSQNSEDVTDNLYDLEKFQSLTEEATKAAIAKFTGDLSSPSR